MQLVSNDTGFDSRQVLEMFPFTRKSDKLTFRLSYMPSERAQGLYLYRKELGQT
jgi:hypothetical protein